MTVEIKPLCAFKDNYVWCVRQSATMPWVVIDPGEAAPVMTLLGEQPPAAILLTHHHNDHIGGVAVLRERYHAPIYGPADIAEIDHPLKGGEKLSLAGLSFHVFATPGHTLDHLCYELEGEHPALFSGDTLFSGGSGRLFEGTAEQLFKSFRQFDALPDETMLCPGHEYTQGNLKFIASLGQDSPAFQARVAEVARLREAGRPSVPVTLGVERQTNPFLTAPSVEALAQLRQQKDQF
ncbi:MULTISPECIES: hydroxyacylglutathione hydrolase [Bombella]|uniref:Hydroxyacylglutathione hydrolase n=1 Tax=Bombella saccharophila TaxID=2967338 RepID=A0ABT3W7R4_9PROT|nr:MULTISPECIES: hydroxyacylglutathione hydrolase [Bombella]MCX5615126.1 hydroxyacylglutathione hydrolase [Bombella saccharophila]MUG90531.1 hydroxyacylglutathione hydrolase [Bombella sp. ESL0385]